MNNKLFKDSYSDWISNLSEKFKSRCLFYQIKTDYSRLLSKVGNNYEFKRFLQNKHKNSRFDNIIQFYEKYLLDRLKNNASYDFFNEIISVNFAKIAIKWYFEKSDYDNFIKEYNIKKLIINFSILKWQFFLDFSDDEDKIYVNIELIMWFLKITNWKLIEQKDIVIYTSLVEVWHIFLDSTSNNNEFIKSLTSLYNTVLKWKYSKWDTFFLTIYNKINILSDVNNLDLTKIKQSFDNLINRWFISKKIGFIFDVLSNDIYFQNHFIYLWLNNIAIIENNNNNEIIFPKNIFEEVLEKWIKNNLKTYDKIDWTNIIIYKDLKDNFLDDYKIEIVRQYFDTNNINKKNIKYTLKEIKEHNSISYLLDDWLQWFIEEFFDLETSKENYHILLEPLSIASKKMINSNMYYWKQFDIPKLFEKIWLEYLEKYKNKYLKIDDFIIDFFEKDITVYLFFKKIREYILWYIWRKISDWEMMKYLLSEKQLFKRLLVYLSRIWYIDIAWKNEWKDIYYYSWDGYGWWYGLSEKEEYIEIFEPEYIKFKDVNLDVSMPTDNHISWNDIYFSLENIEETIKAFSKFTKLEKIENYAILSINRDILIKAKNEYSISAKDIFKEFKNLELEIPKNLEILIHSIDKQKVDLNIIPAWIPIILENIWIFNEFLKLKLFNKYILYSNEKLKLIVFDEKFKSLEKTLNTRKILYKIQKQF